MKFFSGTALILLLILTRPALGGTGPALTVKMQGTNVAITWPTNYPKYGLQFSTNLAKPQWLPLSSPDILNGLFTHYDSPSGSSSRYFRLTCGTNAPPYPLNGAGIAGPGPTVYLNATSPPTFTFTAPPLVDPADCDNGLPLIYHWEVTPPIAGLSVNTPTLSIPANSVNPGPVDGAYTLTFTITGGTGLSTNLTKGVTFLAEPPAEPTCTPVHQPPNLSSGSFIVLITGASQITRNIVNLSDGTANAIHDNTVATLDASAYVDPFACPGDPPLEFHWVITSGGITPFADAGITGYHSSKLNIAAHALLNGSTTFELTVTGPNSGLTTTINVISTVNASALTPTIYNSCQNGVGSCPIAAGQPPTETP